MKLGWETTTRGTGGTFSLGFSFGADSEGSTPAPACPQAAEEPAEREALRAFFNATSSPASPWIDSTGWSTAAAAVSSWFGVEVDATSGRVTSLDLSSNNLTGCLSDLIPHLQALPSLSRLRLSNNSLGGFLPAELAAMPALTVLDVSRNLLVGTTPRAFAERDRDFEWFDCTGNNDMSIFYRASGAVTAAERKSGMDPVPAVRPGGAGKSKTTKHVDEGAGLAKGHRLGSVFLTEGVLCPEDCDEVVRLAEEHVSGQGGWRNDRHTMYRTTDVDVRDVPPLLEMLNERLREAIMPTMAELFGLSGFDLKLEDLFVAKYSVGGGDSGGDDIGGSDGGKRMKTDGGGGGAKGEERASAAATASTPHQASLKAHRDDSELSFVLLLNDADNFEGGGTQFVDWRPPFVAAPSRRGTMSSFCGLQRHAGRAITNGTRYILAGFVHVFDEGRALRKEGERVFPRFDGD